MTPEQAAQAAADRDETVQRTSPFYLPPMENSFRDLYLRAFLAGVAWQQQHEQRRVETLENAIRYGSARLPEPQEPIVVPLDDHEME